MLQFAARAFPWFAVLIALAFAWMGFDELQHDSARRPQQLPSVLFAFAISVLFGLTAASVWLRWSILRPAAVVCGGCAALYAISILMRGWGDDASGVMGPLLLSIAVITAGSGLIVGVKRPGP
jgi:peptidoglycan/LPS O-acetylase OafA/YrhL